MASVANEAKHVSSLALPIVISMAGATLIGVVDTIMIAPLGTIPLAAASLTTAFLIIFYSALYGFISVIGVRMAEAFGAKDQARLARVTFEGLRIALIVGAVGCGVMLALRHALPYFGQPSEVIAALGGYWTMVALMLVPFTLFYTVKGLFDAINVPWIGVGLAFLAVILNVPANWVLIYGIGNWDGLGLTGAGVASLLSETVSLVLALLIWRKSKALAVARAPAQSDAGERKVQLTEGAAVSLGYLGEGGAYGIASLMMGFFSATALAAHQIVNAVGGVLYLVPLGVAIAVSIRIGQAIGDGQMDRLRHIGLGALGVIFAWMAVAVVGILVFAAPISNALSDDPAVVGLAISLFIITAMMQIFDGIQGTMAGACRGMTDNVVPVSITLMSYWIIALPLAYMLGVMLEYGPVGVWIGYGIGLALAAILMTARFFWKTRLV